MALMDVFITMLFMLLIILGFSALVGTVMFCLDIWKWSKRPEKFESFEKDLSNDDIKVKEVIHNE